MLATGRYAVILYYGDLQYEGCAQDTCEVEIPLAPNGGLRLGVGTQFVSAS